MRKVAVALSGGVDSSVSAFLLKRDGFDVIGITLKLSSVDSCDDSIQVCCSTKDILDAKKVANFLGIPHFVVDWQEIFKEKVIDYFVREYISGKTPNPCAVCNREVKTGLLAMYVKRVLKVDFLATGHYIRTADIDGKKVLLRGLDTEKDQSYFLSLLPAEVVDILLFPVGQMSKFHVRRIAREEGIPVSDKKESFEICFTAGKDPYQYLSDIGVKPEEGEIVHVSGKVLGKHKGLVAYTVGQRRGISVAWKDPLYVIDKDITKNSLIVGEKEYLMSREVEADNFNLLLDPKHWKRVKVQGRYRQKPVDVEDFHLQDGKIRVWLKDPQPKFAVGQVLAVYTDDILAGGGIITKS